MPRFPSSLRFLLGCLSLFLAAVSLTAAQPEPGKPLFAKYFELETARLRDACLAKINTRAEWEAKRPEYRRQLFEMLGLDPLPERTDLKPEITATTEHEEFIVERLHFQSLPGLYVTGNLYRPRQQEGPLPAVLYLCGHGRVKIDGVSYGNKVHYQHHGEWFARNGYVCLTIDSLQLGEIEGFHHGTHNLGKWWWLPRGYTPAGVEAWNCIRALDYLQTRKEVDGERLGCTGRSGGGAYSWWIAALDERIRCAVPVAGITDLENHVVDGCVDGHCDCMYFLNTHQWDYPLVAALVAPRPLLISNTDADRIFPLEGVVRTHEKVRKIYRLLGAGENLGLQITYGPHKDTQELHLHAFRWLNKHLKGEEALIRTVAEPLLEPADLKVFEKLPEDQLNTEIHETFVAAAPEPEPPRSNDQWQARRKKIMQQLGEQTFAAWPSAPGELELKETGSAEVEGVRLTAYEFTSQEPFRLKLWIAHRADLEPADLITLNVLDDASWNEFTATYGGHFGELLGASPAADAEKEKPAEDPFESTRRMFQSFPWAMAYVAPRGVGPTGAASEEAARTKLRRRFYLLGQTLEGQQVYDVRRAIAALRGLEAWEKTPLWLQSQRDMAGITLYASLFEENITRLDLHDLPTSHRQGPCLLNVLRITDLPQTVVMAAERSQVVLYHGEPQAWAWPKQVIDDLAWRKTQLQLRPPLGEPGPDDSDNAPPVRQPESE